VTHDLSAVRQFCDRVLYVKGGRAMAIGTPSEVIDKYIYEDRLEEYMIDEAKQEVSGHVVHSGNKEIEITKVEYLDRHDKNNEKFISGDPITLRIHYKRNKNVASVVCGIAIYKDDGTHVYGTNSFLQEKKIELKKTGYVDFKTDSLNLLFGNYAMTVAFHSDEGKAYDWRDKEFYFTVINSSKDDGFIKLDFKFNS